MPGGSVTGNDKVWRQFTFASISTSKIRVTVNDTLTHDLTRIVEVEAWTGPSGSALAEVNWLVADQLGTPRIILDKTGSLATTKRHDYLPFGEELFAGMGGRTSALGYTGDAIRQKFTEKERDTETGLDFFEARYYSNVLGRFTSADPDNAGAKTGDPQSWNGYSYALNNPLRYTDPTGLTVICRQGPKVVSCAWLYDQIRKGNFEVVTFTSAAGVTVTVRRSDFYKPGKSVERADGTLVTTTTFDQSAFLAAAGNLVRMVQEAEGEESAAPTGFGGAGDFGGGGQGGCVCDGVGAMRRLRYVGVDYHGQRASGRKSAGPTNGQDALDNSVQVRATSPRRVGVDYATGEFVVFDQTVPGEFHGHVRTWRELSPQMKNALVGSGMATRSGKIITGGG